MSDVTFCGHRRTRSNSIEHEVWSGIFSVRCLIPKLNSYSFKFLQLKKKDKHFIEIAETESIDEWLTITCCNIVLMIQVMNLVFELVIFMPIHFIEKKKLLPMHCK